MTYFHFKCPATIVLAGSSGSGKTTFVQTLLAKRNEMFDKKFEKILWCYGEPAAKPDIEGIDYYHGVPENIENPGPGHMLIIFDDLMTDCYTKQICNLFTRGSHHQLISCLLLNQVLFYKSALSRTISLNTKYLICFKSPRDKRQFEYLARQMYPQNSKELVRVFNEATSQSFSHFVIDFSQETNDWLRYKTDIFNPLYTCICYVNTSQKNDQVKFETIEGQQAYVICA